MPRHLPYQPAPPALRLVLRPCRWRGCLCFRWWLSRRVEQCAVEVCDVTIVAIEGQQAPSALHRRCRDPHIVRSPPVPFIDDSLGMQRTGKLREVDGRPGDVSAQAVAARVQPDGVFQKAQHGAVQALTAFGADSAKPPREFGIDIAKGNLGSRHDIESTVMPARVHSDPRRRDQRGELLDQLQRRKEPGSWFGRNAGSECLLFSGTVFVMCEHRDPAIAVPGSCFRCRQKLFGDIEFYPGTRPFPAPHSAANSSGAVIFFITEMVFLPGTGHGSRLG